MSRKIIMFLATVIFFIVTIMIQDSQAIPAFARKYKISCNTCHVAVPKLKAYGEDFAGNGFKLPDGEEPKRAYVNTGDETLTLMRELPLAVRFDAYLQAADRENAKTDIQAPYGLKLLSGGPISEHVSYYFYFYISERGEVAGVEDAIIHFNDIGGTDLDLALGQFQVSDPLFKRELRLTFEDYMIYKINPGMSKANLTYDRGIMATYGFDFGLDLTGMVLNGNGIKEAGDDRLFDFDSEKSFAFRATQDIGFVRIGGFVYAGSETDADTGTGVAVNNDIMIFGPDFTIGNDYIELNGQYLLREDKRANFLENDVKAESKGGFVELIYMPDADQSKFLFTALYNFINSDISELDYETATFSVSHMAARNLRILSEVTYNMNSKKTIFTLGVASAF